MNKELDKTKSQVTIIGYHDDYQPDLKRLNYEWLEKYFCVEASDEASLSEPRKHIINKGGHVYFAQYKGDIVGCAALMKVTDNIYELSKMAVSPKAQGLGIGTQLLLHGIQLAKTLNIDKLILYSNTSLASAIHLYRKYGFQEIPLEEGLYDRADIKMELNLQDNL